MYSDHAMNQSRYSLLVSLTLLLLLTVGFFFAARYASSDSRLAEKAGVEFSFMKFTALVFPMMLASIAICQPAL